MVFISYHSQTIIFILDVIHTICIDTCAFG
jgi:hypothetical protein